MKDRNNLRSATDRALGMDRAITRRDFVQGAAAGAAALALPFAVACSSDSAALSAGVQDQAGYYPPLLNGMRGSHPGSFEAAHSLRDGNTPSSLPTATGEHYDLIVVGGGISGLAAAQFFRAQAGTGARVLVLENHDDFGGHAKRNEFDAGGRMHLMNGGTMLIDSPRPYSPVAAGLIESIGIDVERLAKTGWDTGFYDKRGLGLAAFLDRETFGADALLVGVGKRPVGQLLAGSPLSARAQADIERIETGAVDFMPGLTSAQKKDRLSRMSYAAFLADVVKVDPMVVRFYQAHTHGEWGVGTDAISALDCWGIGLPGFAGMKLEPGAIARMGYTPAGYADTGGSTRFHFPDGNASIARLLVRKLIPAAVPGSSAEDVVTARVDYAKLDERGAPVRIRLNSLVTRVKHAEARATGPSVEVTYVRGGRAYTASAGGCVLASWNGMIPYLCPELPEAQKAALHSLVKTPLVYTSIAIRNWRAFEKLGVSRIHAPGSYHSYVQLNPHSTLSGYTGPLSADEPTLVELIRTPCQPGLPEMDQHRIGRAELLATSFETFEREIRSQLGRILGAGGFDPAHDITAITVNRWPHGYAPEYNPLWDDELPDDQRPWVLGRRRFGRIAIANADSGGGAYTDIAIDQAHRAVAELLGS